jgi:hypothetical protein
MAAPQSQVIPIPLGVEGGGIDSRSDSKAVLPPRLAACVNGSFRRPGAIEKRYGMQPKGAGAWKWEANSTHLSDSIEGARAVIARGDELLMVAKDRLLSYSDVENSWIQRDGGVYPVTVEHGAFFPPVSLDYREADVAVADGIEVTATSTDGTTYLHLRDETTGQTRRVLVSGTTSRPRVLAIGDDLLVMWGTSAGSLHLLGLNRGNIGTIDSGDSVIVVTTDVSGKVWDACVSGGRILLVYYASGGDVKFGYVTPAGALDGSLTTQTPTAAPVVITCCVEATTRYFFIGWGMDASSEIEGRIFAEDKTAAVVLTTIDTSVTGFRALGSIFPPDSTGVSQSLSKIAHVYYEIEGASSRDHTLYAGFLTQTASAGGDVHLRHCGLASKPWSADDAVWMLLAHENTLQRSYFMMRQRYTEASTDDVAIVGQFLDGSGLLRPTPHIGQVAPLGDGRYRWAAPTREIISGQDTNWKVQTIDLNIDPAVTFAPAAGAAYLPGAALWRIDAHVASEAGFWLYPEGAVATPANGSGSMTNSGAYQYRFHYAITYPSGHREISTAVEVSVTLGASDDEVSWAIPTLSLTNKLEGLGANVSIEVYRKNPDTTLFYRVSNPDSATAAAAANGYIENDGTASTGADTVTWVDRLADAAIEENEPDYLDAENENLPSGPCSSIAAGNSRVFIAGGQDPDVVWPSKLVSFGVPVNFWDVGIGIDAGDGPITGMSVLDDNLVVFRERQTYIVGGDGPGNTGTGGEFSPARLISNDIGCTDARSIVRIPAGVMFRSAKGIYLLQGAEPVYVGAAVEGELADGVITSAVALPDRHEVRFLMADKTLVYDYLAQAWSTWTIGGLSACLWQGQWTVLADADGTVLVETPGTYADNGVPYSMRIRLPWIRTGAMQGFQLFQLLQFLGSYKSAHVPVVRLAYDFEGAFVDVFPWDDCAATVSANAYGDDTPYGEGQYGGETDGLPATTVYQFQVRPSQPRAQAIQIEFEDEPVPGGAALGESYSLSEVAMKIALKSGPMRLGPDKTA